MSHAASDTTPEAERVQLDLIRRMPIARRVASMRSLSRTVAGLARRGIALAHPKWTPTDLGLLFVEVHYGAELARRLRGHLRSRAGTGLENAADNIHPEQNPMESSDLFSALAPVLAALDAMGVAYYIGGSVASSSYGVARATLDVDLAADLAPQHVAPLVKSLESAYYVDARMIASAIGRRSCFNVIHLATMIKVDVFVVPDRAYDRQILQRTRAETLDETDRASVFRMASPEDVILKKLEWFRLGEEVSERQWSDVLGVLKVQGDLLDIAYLKRWGIELGVADLVERALVEAARE
ncbi:MAG: hypothetical protein ACYC35_15835 [Pirellulales bacterium]